MPEEKQRILFLLADSHLRDIFSFLFEENGWETESAADFPEAERKAVRFRPHVLLFDAHLVGDVPKTLKRCASLPTLHAAKLVVFGTDLKRSDIRSAMTAGAVDVVIGGHVTPQSLERRLANLIS